MHLDKIFCTLALLAVIPLHAEVLKTGSQVTKLPSLAFLDDTPRKLDKFLGRKFIVLYLWETTPASLQEFAAAANVAAASREIADFIGIGIGKHDDLKNFPGALRLGFPMNSDNGEAKKLFLRPGDTLPLAVILDKDGILLWRGSLRNVQKILRECVSGKFNLAEQIRMENFTREVDLAIKNEDLTKATGMLREEYDKHPEKLNLLRRQIKLLKQLNRRNEAFAELHKAQKKLPDQYRVFEMEYQLIAEENGTDKLPDFFSRLKENFSDNPAVLIAFAMAECKLPPDKLNLAFAVDLAETGWKNQQFINSADRGQYALEYAKILHSIGRNDLAQILAQGAVADLQNYKNMLPAAEAALIYYTKINGISSSIKLPDLTKP